MNSVSKKHIPHVQILINKNIKYTGNDKGQFHLNDFHFELYEIEFHKTNYHTVSLSKIPKDGKIFLKPISFLADKVEITENKIENSFKLPVNTFHIHPETIENFISTQEIVQTLPGIHIKSYGGRAGVSTASVHGGQSQRFAVLFDGVNINNEQNGGADITQIPTFLLSEVEYLPQGHSSRFGTSAMTGILNFKPIDSVNKISITKGNFNEFSGNIILNKKMGNNSYSLGMGKSLFDAQYNYKELGNYSDVPWQQDYMFNGLRNAISQQFLYANIGVQFKASILHSTYLYVDNSRKLSTNVYSSPIEIEDMYDNLKTLSVGLEHRNSKMLFNQKQTQITYLGDTHSLLTNKISFVNVIDNFGSSISIINVKNKSTKTIDTTKTYAKASIDYNLKYNHADFLTTFTYEIEENQSSIFSFDLLLNYNFSSQFQSAFTYSRNYKKPNFNDLFWEPFGDPNLKTEFSDNFYIKNNFISNFGEVNVDFHYINFDQLINWRPMIGTSAYWIPQNISSAHSYGTDISITSSLISDYKFSSSYSFNKSQNFNLSLSEHHQGKPLLYTPTHSGTLQLEKQLKHISLLFSSNFVGSRVFRYNWPEDNKLPGYSTSTLIFNYKVPTYNSNLILKCENIFDTQYQSVFGFPIPGRSFSLTIIIKDKI